MQKFYLSKPQGTLTKAAKSGKLYGVIVRYLIKNKGGIALVKRSFEDVKHDYPPEDVNDELIYLFLDAGHVLRGQYEGRGSQRRILIVLLSLEPVTQRELTERLGIQPGSASEVIGKLEAGGLICRSPGSTDRRTMDISLTDAGREKALAALHQRQERHRQMFSALTETEKETLRILLEKLRDDWTERYRTPERDGCGHRSRKQGGM